MSILDCFVQLLLRCALSIHYTASAVTVTTVTAHRSWSLWIAPQRLCRLLHGLYAFVNGDKGLRITDTPL